MLFPCNPPRAPKQVWDVLGEKRVGLFALKPLRKDVELTIDYSASHVGERGLENHCESLNRGGARGQREIPFKEYVEDVIQRASLRGVG